MTDQHSSTVGDLDFGPPDAQLITLEALPVELLAQIFSELDLDSLVLVSCLSRRLRDVTADSSLNPWRRPILRSLHCRVYQRSLFHLSLRSIVPRQNWIEILTFASAKFLLFDSTLPSLKSSEWEECFRRRFLPGWTKWKRDDSWRETFMKMLYRVWHRSRSSCTSDESWTKYWFYQSNPCPNPQTYFLRYIVVNRNGSVNELEAASRGFNPLAICHEMKLQNDLAHLPTQIRIILQLMDVRILALGVVNRPRTPLMVNRNAHAFLYPPGLDPPGTRVCFTSHLNTSDPRVPAVSMHHNPAHRCLSYPMPSRAHSNYPMYTPGGGDQRWHPDLVLEEGTQWVGGLMVTVQLHPCDPSGSTAHGLQGSELFDGINHTQFASFTWRDFLAIAPWMEQRITKCIYGQGLGIY